LVVRPLPRGPWRTPAAVRDFGRPPQKGEINHKFWNKNGKRVVDKIGEALCIN
jgi:hypothetical protein